ncbi:MAG: glycosyltransferase family 39 protein [Anaerolineae bacterium]|nr:glycosyltransferase family 39 protein [Anaerolineae bacterium]
MAHTPQQLSTPKWLGILPYVLLFLLAFVPRVVALNAYVASDEAKWILRSAYFLTSLRSGDFGAAASQIATPEVDVLAPAVTTMWSGAAGLIAKYYADGATVPLDDYLAALPYAHSEQMPLDFYPWLRFPTALITALFVVAFYDMLRRVVDNNVIALSAAVLLALDPFFLNHSRVIHHDALVTVFVNLSLLSALRYMQVEKPGWLIFSGLSLGLAMATKPTSLILIPFVGLLFLWTIYQTRRWSLLGWAILWGVIGLATFVAVWPALWADPLGTLARLTETSATGATGQDERPLIPALIPGRLPELGFLYYPINFLLRWGILPTLGLMGALVAWLRGDKPESGQTRSALGWLLLFSLLMLLALIPLGTRDIRYYLPAWPSLLTIAAFGLIAALNWLRLRAWLKPVVIAAASLILLMPYYPYYITYFNPLFLGPYLAPKLARFGGGVGLDQAAAYLNTQPDADTKTAASYVLEAFRPYFVGGVSEHKSGDFADFTVNYIRQIQNQHPSAENLAYFAARTPDDTVRLNGVDYAYVYLLPPPRPVKDVAFGPINLVAQTLDARYAQPGHQHQLTLLWQAPPEAAAQTVHIQLRDAGGTVWSETDGPLLTPNSPSSVEGHYSLDFPAEMPRGDYGLWVAIDQAEPVKFADIGVHRLTPPDLIPQPLTANFDGWLILHGYDLSRQPAHPGEALTVALYWQAKQQRPLAYTNFVHLVDAAGNTVAQTDVTPGGGAFPTNTWVPGEWLTDTVILTLPSDLPFGQYQLLIGWYYWETLERLPLLEDTSGQNVVIIPDIAVE